MGAFCDGGLYVKCSHLYFAIQKELPEISPQTSSIHAGLLLLELYNSCFFEDEAVRL